VRNEIWFKVNGEGPNEPAFKNIPSKVKLNFAVSLNNENQLIEIID